MKKIHAIAGICALAIWGIAGNAEALQCPSSFGTTYDRIYEVDPATACAFGDGNLSPPNQDAFLGTDGSAGAGITYIDAAIGDPSTWAAASGLTLNSNGTWSISGGDLSTTDYLVGIKDGSTPSWAVFLVTALSGTWAIYSPNNQGGMQLNLGALSHYQLYSREGGTPNVQPQEPVVPEPASLLLLGSGLALAGQRFRRRRQALKG